MLVETLVLIETDPTNLTNFSSEPTEVAMTVLKTRMQIRFSLDNWYMNYHLQNYQRLFQDWFKMNKHYLFGLPQKEIDIFVRII